MKYKKIIILMENWLNKARNYSKTVLGIMTLMLIIDYTYMLGAIVWGDVLGTLNQSLLVLFAVLFPFFLFGGLLWIIAKHPIHTIDVRNFKEEETYLKVLRMVISISKKYKNHHDSSETEQEKRENVEEYVCRTMEYVKSKSKERRYILWVDDKSANNTYERIALEQLGYCFTLASSTEEALSLVYKKDYKIIISDMERQGDADAGYLLLKQLRLQGLNIPYIIYTGYCNLDSQKEAKFKGASGLTDNPEKLIELIVKIDKQNS